MGDSLLSERLSTARQPAPKVALHRGTSFQDSGKVGRPGLGLSVVSEKDVRARARPLLIF